MRINVTNHEKVKAALADVNGRASQHVWDRGWQIEAVADEAEAKLDSLGLPKSARAGAVAFDCSISPLPNSYTYQVTGTSVRLERGAKGWFLTEVRKTVDYPRNYEMRIVLTPEQDAEIIRRIRDQYCVVEQAA